MSFNSSFDLLWSLGYKAEIILSLLSFFYLFENLPISSAPRALRKGILSLVAATSMFIELFLLGSAFKSNGDSYS